ncbi:MAG TPA: DUF3108 domain-containing protein [Pyrinomonadaceae bacterium]|nr:DUF3108 domain-containing protein [Pyrinomonadaceae bacterium]
MKPPFISTIAVLLFALIFPLFAQEKEEPAPLTLSQTPYRVGERLTYNVSFSNFPDAAHVEVEVVSRGNFQGRDAIQLRAHVETTGVVNVALLAINNDYVTYIYPETGLPFRSERTARDVMRTADAAEDFNQTAGNEAIAPKQEGFPGTYDLLSAFYRARALPLAPGGVYNVAVRHEATDYQAELRVVDRETIRTNVGSFPTIVAQVKVNDTPLKNIRVYFSADPGHVPVLITARVSNGELRAELAGSELLKSADETPTPTPEIKPAPAPTPPPAPTLGENVPFTIGEQLNYQVFIGSSNTALGLATFQVRNRARYFERDGVLLSVNAETTGAAARLFVAKDQIESYVDPKGFLPYRVVMNLVEGQRRLNQTLTFNQEGSTVTSDRGARIEIPVGTHDYLSFFYALRTFDLRPPKKNAVSILVENKPKTMVVDVSKREMIQLGNRSVPAIALKLTTDDPEPDKYQLRLWISDDRRRLPLRLTCTTKLGPLRADLAILPTATQ